MELSLPLCTALLLSLKTTQTSARVLAVTVTSYQRLPWKMYWAAARQQIQRAWLLCFKSKSMVECCHPTAAFQEVESQAM